MLVLPELTLATAASVILLVGTFFRRGVFALSLITLAITAGFILISMPSIPSQIFENTIIIDRFGSILKLALCLLLGLIFIYSRVYMQLRNLWHGEFFVLSLLSMLGMMLIISSNNFLVMYLGLELFVLPLYALIVMTRNNPRYTEAAIKYFIIGSLGAAIILYGISFVYAATGSFGFITTTNLPNVSLPALQLGMLFIIVGLALEFAAVPFHMWLPDVYEGSPTVVTMLVATLPKIAVFAITYRLLTISFINLSADWMQIFMILATLSLALGNLLAIAQTNIKRMLAYSTIGHIGFILLGLFAAQNSGYVAVAFYALTYALMVLAALAVIMHMTAKGFEADNLKDFVGLAQTEPWLAFIMLLIMFSLAGVPPLLGFYAKFLILQNVVAAGYPKLAIVALIFSVIGSFYYLRVIKNMYFEHVNVAELPSKTTGMSAIASKILYGHGVLLLLLGITPGVVLMLCLQMFGG